MAGRLLALQPNIGDAAEFSIAGSGTIIGSAHEGLAGMQGFDCQVRFLLGTGSGGVTVYVQTSLDQGNYWGDTAKFSFDDLSVIQHFRIAPGTVTPVTPTSGGTGDSPEIADGIVSPVLGDRLRAYVVVTGTYQNTILSIRLHVWGF